MRLKLNFNDFQQLISFSELIRFSIQMLQRLLVQPKYTREISTIGKFEIWNQLQIAYGSIIGTNCGFSYEESYCISTFKSNSVAANVRDGGTERWKEGRKMNKKQYLDSDFFAIQFSEIIISAFYWTNISAFSESRINDERTNESS